MFPHRSIAVLLATLAVGVYAQYGNYRPYPMSMQSGFSPYHPARINHETLPISQAEFAQLVAESMATSNGPHHHHPPNTEADYEAADHYRSYHGGGGRRGQSQEHGEALHHQPSAPHQHPEAQYHHDGGHDNHHHHHHHHQQEAQDQYDQEQPEHGGSAGYQPEENENDYPRQAVYENEHKGEEATDEEDNYGGKPSEGQYESYDEGTGDHEQGNQAAEEDNGHGQGNEQYVAAASEPIVHRYRYIVDTHK